MDKQLTEEEAIEHYRHDYGRKVGDWDDVAKCGTVKIPKAHAKLLTKYDRKVHAIDDTFSSLPTGAPMVFLLKDGKRTFLVNTEGFNYCRYAVLAKVV